MLNLFFKEPKSELLLFKGSILPLISILVAFISFIYALLQFLLTSPNLKVLFVEGIIFPLTEVKSIGPPYTSPFIVLTLKSLVNILLNLFVEEPKLELLVSKGTMLPLIVIFETLTSFIYALPHGLLERPRVPLFGTSGFKLRLTSIDDTLTSRI